MNAALMPLVSIITPVFNEAEYLVECIESLLAQTYQNWDCTIVNNCSTDGSAKIAHQYAARDPRIRVHENQQFLRAVPNYNLALHQVSPASKYCKLVFADDWIFPECLEKMVAVAEEHPSVGIVGAYGLKECQVVWDGLQYPTRLMSGREVCRRLYLEGLYVFGTGTSLLFRADIVRSRNPFYDESNLHADLEACTAILKTCDFGFVHQVLTFTRVRQGSLTLLSKELDTHRAGRLQNLVTHGPDYLTPKEFEACLNRTLSDYYEFLARNLGWCRDKKFWDYHRRKLTDAGVGFDRARLARAFLAKLVSSALNPKSTIEKLLAGREAGNDPAFVLGSPENTAVR